MQESGHGTSTWAMACRLSLRARMAADDEYGPVVSAANDTDRAPS
jgi:hypothetical protein